MLSGVTGKNRNNILKEWWHLKLRYFSKYVIEGGLCNVHEDGKGMAYVTQRALEMMSAAFGPTVLFFLDYSSDSPKIHIWPCYFPQNTIKQLYSFPFRKVHSLSITGEPLLMWSSPFSASTLCSLPSAPPPLWPFDALLCSYWTIHLQKPCCSLKTI